MRTGKYSFTKKAPIITIKLASAITQQACVKAESRALLLSNAVCYGSNWSQSI